MTLYDSTDISFGNMKFGEPLDVINPDVDEYLGDMKSMFVEQIWLLADALNADIDEVTVDIEAIPAAAGSPDLRPAAEGGHHRRAALEHGRAARRRAPHRDRDAVDRRRGVPGALARPRARLDADHRGRPVDAGPLPDPGQLHAASEHRRARPGRQHRHRNAGAQRRARGVRSACRVSRPMRRCR